MLKLKLHSLQLQRHLLAYFSWQTLLTLVNTAGTHCVRTQVYCIRACHHGIYYSYLYIKFIMCCIWVSIVIVRYLELESSGRRNEIRFIYTSLDAWNNPKQHTESFSYTLADSKWHKVSLTVSGPEIQLLVDCHLIYRRVAEHMPDRNFSASEMHLFVGQRDNQYQLKVSNVYRRKIRNGKWYTFVWNCRFMCLSWRLICMFWFIFTQGYIQDAYIVSGPNGYLKQCPNMATQCPTCGQFSLLEKTIDDLIKNLDELKQRVSTSSNNIFSFIYAYWQKK